MPNSLKASDAVMPDAATCPPQRLSSAPHPVFIPPEAHFLHQEFLCSHSYFLFQPRPQNTSPQPASVPVTSSAPCVLCEAHRRPSSKAATDLFCRPPRTPTQEWPSHKIPLTLVNTSCSPLPQAPPGWLLPSQRQSCPGSSPAEAVLGAPHSAVPTTTVPASDTRAASCPLVPLQPSHIRYHPCLATSSLSGPPSLAPPATDTLQS